MGEAGADLSSGFGLVRAGFRVTFQLGFGVRLGSIGWLWIHLSSRGLGVGRGLGGSVGVGSPVRWVTGCLGSA